MFITPNLDSMRVAVSGPLKEMMSSRVENGKTFVRVNTSSLSLMQECWRKTYYSLERNLRSNSEGEATLFGTAIHKALEVFYLAPFERRTLPAGFRKDFELLAGGHDEGKDYLIMDAARAFKEKMIPLASLPEDNKRSLASGLWLLSYYFEKYHDDPWIALCDSEGKPFVEKDFNYIILDTPTLQIEVFGRIDLILTNPHTMQVVVTDHKTTSMMGEDFFNRCAPNFQYTNYVLGTNLSLGIKTDTFLVNGIGVKAKPKTARGSPPTFIRQPTMRVEEDFDELRRAMKMYVKIYLDLKSKSEPWPQTTPGPCAMWGGCQYREICSSPKSLQENIITLKYHNQKEKHDGLPAANLE